MFVAVLTHDIGQRMHVILGVSMVQAPLPKHQGEEDNGKPLFGRFVRLHPKVGQAQMLFDVEIVHLDGPALLIDAQDLLCRQREVGAQKILRVFVPRVPFADEDTDLKRQVVELPLEWSHQVRALSSVCRGQLDALIPLVSERLGPLGELLVVERPIGLDRREHSVILTSCSRRRIPMQRG